MHRIPSLLIAFVACVPALALAQDVQLLLFDLDPSTAYDVSKNSQYVNTVNTSPRGVVTTRTSAVAGDELTLRPDGAAVPPLAPSNLVVTGGNDGCARAAWTPNPEADVIMYRLYVRPTGTGGWTDSSDVFTDTTLTVCGLVADTYDFGLRAGNAAGLLSAMSNHTSASVSTGDAQPPPPPQLTSVKTGDPGCAVVGWLPSGDPTVVGYVVDYATTSGSDGGYDVSIDAGAATSIDVCGLAVGDYYFAVRAKNNLDIMSAHSNERTVSIVVTSVLIRSFVARDIGGAVALEWDIQADEAIASFTISRAGDADPPAARVVSLPPSADRFVDGEVRAGVTYEYVLTVTTSSGERFASIPAEVTTAAVALALEQNAPNPFNPSTAIAFTLPDAQRAAIAVYDVHGRLVRSLLDEVMGQGRHVVRWDGTTATGRSAASGTYFYRLVTAGRVLSRKMLLVK